jgi:hypothetical protein
LAYNSSEVYNLRLQNFFLNSNQNNILNNNKKQQTPWP